MTEQDQKLEPQDQKLEPQDQDLEEQASAPAQVEPRTLKGVINTPFKKAMFIVQIISYVLIVGVDWLCRHPRVVPAPVFYLD